MGPLKIKTPVVKKTSEGPLGAGVGVVDSTPCSSVPLSSLDASKQHHFGWTERRITGPANKRLKVRSS